MATSKRFVARFGLDNGNNTLTNIGPAASTLQLSGNFTTSGSFPLQLNVTNNTSVTFPVSGTLATLSNTETLTNKTLSSPIINGGVSIAGNATFANDVTVNGNLTVNGTTTTVNSTTITVDDKNIELGSVASPTDSTADGGGITLLGTTNKTIVWEGANGNWTLSEHVNIPTGKVFKINNVNVLSSNTLGSSITNSSLTSVGTITTGVWQASTIGTAYGGTGITATPGTNQVLIGNGSGGYSLSTVTAGNSIVVSNSGGALTIATNSTTNATPNVDVKRDGNAEIQALGYSINSGTSATAAKLLAFSNTISTATATTLFSIPANLYQAADIVISASRNPNSTNAATSITRINLAAIYDGSNYDADWTEYAYVEKLASGASSMSGYVYTVAVSGSNINVMVTQNTATATTYKIKVTNLML